jgi:hypothetical protein
MAVSLEEVLARDHCHSDPGLLDRICFLVDVRRTLLDRYPDQRLIAGPAAAGTSANARTVRAVVDYLLGHIEAHRDIKAINSFLNLADGHLQGMPAPIDAAALEHVKSLIASMGLPQLDDSSSLVNVAEASRNLRLGGTIGDGVGVGVDTPAVAMRDWNSVFVAWNDSPVAAAYLSVLRSRGLVPARLIRAMPARTWKRRARSLLSSTVGSLSRVIGAGRRAKPALPIRAEIFRRAPGDPPVSAIRAFRGRSAPIEVRANNINDERLVAEIAGCNPERVLFTGGGIVRARTFERTGGNWLHMHPGRLPGVRGADGFFWSVLLHGHPTVSAIYQDAGIDTGGVLIEKHFERPEMDAERVAELGSHRHEIVYRTILNLYDPWMRALTLDALLEDEMVRGERPSEASGRVGIEPRGRNYHFMHPLLRARAIDLLVENSG